MGVVSAACASEHTAEYFSAEQCAQLIPRVLQQCVEKLDRIRGVAGTVLERFITEKLPHVPHQEALQDMLAQTRDMVDNGIVDWSAPKVTFSQLLPLIDFEAF